MRKVDYHVGDKSVRTAEGDKSNMDRNSNEKPLRYRRSGAAVLAVLTLAAVTLVPSAQSALAADAGATIVGTETDAAGRTVILRQGIYDGVQGFGWVKIQKKHAIMSKNSVGYVLKAPDGGKAQGEDRLYTAYVNEITCADADCEVTESLEVRVVDKTASREEYGGVTLSGKEVGITTAYCVNPDKAPACPAWVDATIGTKKPTASIDSTADDGTSTLWSYEPLAVGAKIR